MCYNFTTFLENNPCKNISRYFFLFFFYFFFLWHKPSILWNGKWNLSSAIRNSKDEKSKNRTHQNIFLEFVNCNTIKLTDTTPVTSVIPCKMFGFFYGIIWKNLAKKRRCCKKYNTFSPLLSQEKYQNRTNKYWQKGCSGDIVKTVRTNERKNRIVAI